MKITTRGSIRFTEGNEDPTSSSLPSIFIFQAEFDPDNINKFILLFSVDNCASLVLEKTLIDSDGVQVGQVDRSQIAVSILSKSFNKDKTYRTKFKLIATNKNGSTTAELEPISIGTNDLNIFDSNLITSFLVERSTNSYDEVDVKITINNIDNFNFQDLDLLELRYKRQDFSNYLSIFLDKTKATINLNASGNVESYYYEFKNIKIIRQSIGGFFNFLCRITVKNFQSQDTDSLIVYFPDLATSQPRLVDSSDFPNAEILDPQNPASLRYEFLVKFSEVFIHQKNIINFEATEQIRQDSQFYYRFLDSNEVTNLNSSDFLIVDEGGQFLFYYEFNNGKTSGTNGHVYPASVSDILPCIIVNQRGGSNDSVVLFWKINDNFFDYSMMKQSISITTTDFKIKLQYKSGGSYIDITGPISVERKHFQDSTQKFILEIKNTQTTRQDLFNLIKETDNATDNLKIVVISHSVLCSTNGVSSKILTFDKLLIPDQWRYIAYDKYIPSNSDVRNLDNKTISLDLDDLTLRGIRLPEKGFKKFDTISRIRSLVKDSQVSYVSQFDICLFYKLSCYFDSFYLDPIKQGTVNAIVLPNIPDDTFLIAPKVVIPPPNLKKIGEGGIQAEAVVSLDEYGKISAIQLTDIGEGYSYFKNYASKRQQTFSDFTPIVKSSYTIVASDTKLHNDALIPKNLSFDLNNLKASLSGGVRLASVLADKQQIDSSSDGGNPLSELQKTQINQYLENYLPEDASIESNSVRPYQVTSTSINYNAQDVLDETWFELSKLYTEKYNNPLLETNIYNEDDDAGITTVDQSGPSSSIVPSAESSSLTPSSISPSSQQTNATGGQWSLFELSGLAVVPDGSPALFVSNISKSPPWLTLLPLSVRSDGMYSFGPLPNMAPRAEMFNRIVTAINSLNEVRVIAPFIWLVTQNSKSQSWLKYFNPATSDFEIVSFGQDGTKILSYNNVSDYAIPVNASVSVSASRSVAKVEKKAFEVREYGLEQGIYVASSEDGSSLTFKPTVHPFMQDAIPDFMQRNIRRKYLGIVSEGRYSCSSVVPPRAPGTNTTVIYCAIGDGVFPKPIPSIGLPISKFKGDSYFEFFDSGGSIVANPYGTAKFFGVPIGKTQGYQRYCSYECGDSYYKTIDFSYTNMYPATYKL